MAALARPLAVLALTLGACVSVTFDAQDVTLDRDPDADSLTVELVYHDVGALSHAERSFIDFGGTPEGPDVEAAAGFVQAVAAGLPVLILLNPYEELVLDFDPEDFADAPASVRALVAWADGIHIAEASVTVDDEGRIDLRQRVAVPELSRGVALANEAMRAALLGEHQEASAARLTGPEARTYATALADARAGRDWLAWGDGGLVLRIPLDSRHLVGLLQEFAVDADQQFQSDVAQPEAGGLGGAGLTLSMLRELCLVASDLRIDGDHLVLTLGDAEGDLAFTVGPDLDGRLGLEDFRPALREELERRGMTFPAVYTLPE